MKFRSSIENINPVHLVSIPRSGDPSQCCQGGQQGLTCREIGFSVDRWGGGQEGPMAYKEGPKGALGQERRALLGRDVLAAAHATVDLEVQGFALLLGSAKEAE